MKDEYILQSNQTQMESPAALWLIKLSVYKLDFGYDVVEKAQTRRT